MITLSSHKTLLEKNVIKDLKRNKDEVEIEMIPSPSEEPKSAEPESFQKENVSNDDHIFKFNFFFRKVI